MRNVSASRYTVLRFSYIPTTVIGFLRSLNRALGLPMRLHAADLFNAAQEALTSYEGEHGPHPLLVIDDAEGLSAPVLDVIRRLTSYKLDSEDRFSVLLGSTEELLTTLRFPGMDSLRSRIGYAQALSLLCHQPIALLALPRLHLAQRPRDDLGRREHAAQLDQHSLLDVAGRHVADGASAVALLLGVHAQVVAVRASAVLREREPVPP